MLMQRYICIAEGLYEDKASWAAWGKTVVSLRPSGAAFNFVEECPEVSGVTGCVWEEAEPIPVLVKNADTGEIVRVVVETEWKIVSVEAAVDKSFTPPKE